MKAVLSVLLFATLAFASCKKEKTTTAVNYDKTNNVFRVLASSDANYTLTITDTHVNNPTPDTYNVQTTSNFESNYGFTPAVGDQINVTINVPKGYVLYCQISYKDQKIGGDAVTKTANGGLQLTFNYTVGN